MGYRLGVDLGTTFTAAAVDDGTGPAVLGLGNRALTVPSVVYLAPDGSFLLGEPADRRASSEPMRTAREFKRRIGDPVPIFLAGQPLSPQALSAKLLAWVVSIATERQGGPPDEVVVTFPANWGGYKRELLAQIVTLADLPSALTCPEPQAAAAQYAARAGLSSGDRVLVYDLGGGTFDACVLEKRVDGFAILGAPNGVEQLGGIDFDAAVFEYVLGTLSDRMARLDADDPLVVNALAKLRRECVEAKEALSSDVETTIVVELPGVSTSVRMTRAELETLLAEPLQETLEAAHRALRSAGLGAADLTAVVLVGGSSRIPLVSHLLQSELGVRIAMDTHPKHDVALGAVRHQSRASGEPAPAPVAVAQSPAPPHPPAERSPDELPAAPPTRPPTRTRASAGYYAIAAVLALLGVAAGLVLSDIPADPELSWSATDNRGSAEGVDPGTRATTSVLGIPLPGELRIRRNGGFDVPQNTALFAAGPVEAFDDDTPIGTLARSPADPWWRPIATVPGGFMVLALLFAVAYAESQLRSLRRGKGGLHLGELAALTGIGVTVGLSCSLLAWVTGRSLEWPLLIATVVCFAAAFGMLAFAMATARTRPRRVPY